MMPGGLRLPFTAVVPCTCLALARAVRGWDSVLVADPDGVAFDQLASAELAIDRVYRGGRRERRG